MSKLEKLIPAILAHLTPKTLIADPSAKLWHPDDMAWGEAQKARIPLAVAKAVQYDCDYICVELTEGLHFANFTFKERLGFTGKTTPDKLSPGARAVYDFCAKNGLQTTFGRVRYSSFDEESYCYMFIKWDHAHMRKLLAQAVVSEDQPISQETQPTANAHFFFSDPLTRDTGSAAYVLISPDHYGKRISDAEEMAAVLLDKLHAADLEFTSAEPEIEFGNTAFDKGVMRVRLKIEMDLDPEAAVKALTDAGFSQGIPRRF